MSDFRYHNEMSHCPICSAKKDCRTNTVTQMTFCKNYRMESFAAPIGYVFMGESTASMPSGMWLPEELVGKRGTYRPSCIDPQDRKAKLTPLPTKVTDGPYYDLLDYEDMELDSPHLGLLACELGLPKEVLVQDWKYKRYRGECCFVLPEWAQGPEADSTVIQRVAFSVRRSSYRNPESLLKQTYGNPCCRRKRGVILPYSHKENWEGDIYLPEGASDTYALTACGIRAIGRPGADSRDDAVALVLQGIQDIEKRQIIVIAENDQKENGDWPGRDLNLRFAKKLANRMKRTIKVIIPMDGYKDARAVYQSVYANKSAWEAEEPFIDTYFTTIACVCPDFDSEEQKSPATCSTSNPQWDKNAWKEYMKGTWNYKTAAFPVVPPMDADPAEAARLMFRQPEWTQPEIVITQKMIDEASVDNFKDGNDPYHHPARLAARIRGEEPWRFVIYDGKTKPRAILATDDQLSEMIRVSREYCGGDKWNELSYEEHVFYNERIRFLNTYENDTKCKAYYDENGAIYVSTDSYDCFFQSAIYWRDRMDRIPYRTDADFQPYHDEIERRQRHISNQRSREHEERRLRELREAQRQMACHNAPFTCHCTRDILMPLLPGTFRTEKLRSGYEESDILTFRCNKWNCDGCKNYKRLLWCASLNTHLFEYIDDCREKGDEAVFWETVCYEDQIPAVMAECRKKKARWYRVDIGQGEFRIVATKQLNCSVKITLNTALTLFRHDLQGWQACDLEPGQRCFGPVRACHAWSLRERKNQVKLYSEGKLVRREIADVIQIGEEFNASCEMKFPDPHGVESIAERKILGQITFRMLAERMRQFIDRATCEFNYAGIELDTGEPPDWIYEGIDWSAELAQASATNEDT